MHDIERSTMRQVRRRLIYFLFFLFIANFLDRVNLSFAALQMNRDLGFNAEVYGLGAGVLFVGYLLFEIPSNFMLARFGARVWIARIAITWGIAAGCMALVSGTTSFYVVRFFIGLAEAGFAPGVIYLLTLWVPRRHRGIAVVTYAAAIPVASIIGAPLSGWLLSFGEIGGLPSWQMMFLLEAVPSILLGVMALWVLSDSPLRAPWLAPAQRDWLVGQLERERVETMAHGVSSFGAAVRDAKVWTIAIAYFCVSMTTYGLLYWLPQIIKEFSGLGNLGVGFLTAVPFICMLAGLVLNAWHSDRKHERSFHFVGAAAVAACGIILAALLGQPILILAGLCLCAFGLGGVLGVFWTIPMDLLTGTAAVGGLALINMIGNSAGFFGSYLIGWLRQTTGSFNGAVGTLGGLMLVGGFLVLALRLATTPQVPANTIQEGVGS